MAHLSTDNERLENVIALQNEYIDEMLQKYINQGMFVCVISQRISFSWKWTFMAKGLFMYLDQHNTIEAIKV